MRREQVVAQPHLDLTVGSVVDQVALAGVGLTVLPPRYNRDVEGVEERLGFRHQRRVRLADSRVARLVWGLVVGVRQLHQEAVVGGAPVRAWRFVESGLGVLEQGLDAVEGRPRPSHELVRRRGAQHRARPDPTDTIFGSLLARLKELPLRRQRLFGRRSRLQIRAGFLHLLDGSTAVGERGLDARARQRARLDAAEHVVWNRTDQPLEPLDNLFERRTWHTGYGPAVGGPRAECLSDSLLDNDVRAIR